MIITRTEYKLISNSIDKNRYPLSKDDKLFKQIKEKKLIIKRVIPVKISITNFFLLII